MPSIWSESIQQPIRYPALQGDISTDVLVVGGGMAGVLCAKNMADAGIETVLVEVGRIGGGVTANTTAKVTAQHGAVYADLLEKQGPVKAGAYYAAHAEALEKIRMLADGYACDFEEKTAHVYARQNLSLLEREANAYEVLGIPYEYGPVTLPGGDATALGLPGQGQFNPLLFLHEAAKGLTIYENTFVQDIQDKQAITEGGTVTARYIVLATHYPMVNIPGLFFMKLNQQRSYVVALENAPDVNGMYIGLDGGKESFRNYGELLLVGGGNHTTGEPGGQYGAVRQFIAEALPQAVERGAWATQDCISLDKMPYIGVHYNSMPGLLVATGFNKWGMTGAMLAAMMLKDHVLAGKSKYDAVFSPQREMPADGLGHRTAESIKGYLHLTKRCSHMGCALHKNEAENSWDCPCHGSRFSGETGEVLDNPAKKGIRV